MIKLAPRTLTTGAELALAFVAGVAGVSGVMGFRLISPSPSVLTTTAGATGGTIEEDPLSVAEGVVFRLINPAPRVLTTTGNAVVVVSLGAFLLINPAPKV